VLRARGEGDCCILCSWERWAAYAWLAVCDDLSGHVAPTVAKHEAKVLMNAKYLITVWVCGQRDEGESQGASIRRYPLSLSLSPV
jgi:hypothetical protein